MAKKGEYRDEVTQPRPSEIVPKGKEPKHIGGSGILNSKQEKFCHFRALGKTQKEAAHLAGYSGHGANASRLEGIPAVAARIAELKKKYANESVLRAEIEKAELDALIQNEKLDVGYFVKELRANLTLARQQQDVSAANSCLKLMMELLGFLGGKGPKDGKNGFVDPRTPVKVSIINQLANGLNHPDRNAPADGGALRSEPILDALPDVSDNDAELEPDFGLLESAFGENAKRVP